MKRRIFTGVPCSFSLSCSISGWIKKNQSLLPEEARIIQAENWHLTLIPPWYEEDVDSLLLNLKRKIKVVKLSPFEIVFERISLGPTKNNPRLVWLTGKTNPKLIFLKDALEKALGKAGEERSFIPHITLARFKKEKNIKFFESRVRFRERVSSFCVFESKLSSKGTNYEIIKLFNLDGNKNRQWC